MKLTNADVRAIRECYIPKDKRFGALPLAERYGVTPAMIYNIMRDVVRSTKCAGCGKELTTWQRKWCSDCRCKTEKERDRDRMRNGFRHGEKHGGRIDSHLLMEADICLNCERPSCNNCLVGKTMEEKEEMLEKIGGKAWLD